jgi:hypothetical protein
MGIGTLTLMGMLLTPGQGAADLSPINQRHIQIPIRFDPARRGEIKELLLFVSRNQGERWEQMALATPDKDHFDFTAPGDGVYWFNMMVVDKKGDRDPPDMNSAPPGLKVLIDTQAPVISIKSIDRVGDEMLVTWDIQEPYPDLSRLKVEYRTGDGPWLPVEARQSLSGYARFRPMGTGALSVRVQLHDLAGNRGEQVKDTSSVASRPTPSGVMPASNRVTMSDAGADPLSSGSAAPALPPPPAAESRNEVPGTPLAISNPASSPVNGPLPPVQIINVSKFDMAFDVEQKGPSGVSKAEVWVTRDDGRSWLRWSIHEKADGPIPVDLKARTNPQAEGVYGFKIVLQSGAGLSRGAPAAGDLPDMRVDVDLSPPLVKLYEPIPDPKEKDVMILRWQAVDRNMASDPITLEWAESLDGPWHPIVGSDGGLSGPARRLPNSGSYAWKLPANFPAPKVYLKVSARDMAGNISEVTTPQPIIVDLNRPVARIQGIVGAAAQQR